MTAGNNPLLMPVAEVLPQDSTAEEQVVAGARNEVVIRKGFDDIEAKMAQFPQVRLPLNHLFTPGLYIREVLLPAGTLLTSKIHMTEHPFFISRGRVLVWSGIEGEEPQLFGAPYTGVTKAGTRRVIYAYEDTIWSTCHANPTNEHDVSEIESRIIFRHDEHLPFSVTANGEAVAKLLPPPPIDAES
jgi:hypothetical protein